MKILQLALVLALSACQPAAEPASTVKSAGNQVGNLKGFHAINQQINDRLMKVAPGRRFEIGLMLDGQGTFTEDLSGFRSLLGGFGGGSTHSEFQNGTPNSVNMLLWDLLLGQLAKGLSTACAPAVQLPVTQMAIPAVSLSYVPINLKESFLTKLKSACALPADEVARRDLLQGLWLTVMGFEAPVEEFDAWYAYFAGPTSELGSLAPEVRLGAMLKGMFLNPYFILES